MAGFLWVSLVKAIIKPAQTQGGGGRWGMRLHFSMEGMTKDLWPPSIYDSSLGFIFFIYKVKAFFKKVIAKATTNF